MRNGIMKFVSVAVCVLFISTLSGCTVRFHKGHLDDLEKISELHGKLKELEAAKVLLEERLKSQIAKKQVKVDLSERGLVITFLNEILFDSGKAELRKDAYSALDEVIDVIRQKVSDRHIGVEGHTDDQPIQYSGWKSNWELSTARAITVLHYLEDGGVSPKKLRATGFGEHRPVALNATEKARQQNRRVEIVILPKGVDRVTYDDEVKPPSADDVK